MRLETVSSATSAAGTNRTGREQEWTYRSFALSTGLALLFGCSAAHLRSDGEPARAGTVMLSLQKVGGLVLLGATRFARAVRLLATLQLASERVWFGAGGFAATVSLLSCAVHTRLRIQRLLDLGIECGRSTLCVLPGNVPGRPCRESIVSCHWMIYIFGLWQQSSSTHPNERAGEVPRSLGALLLRVSPSVPNEAGIQGPAAAAFITLHGTALSARARVRARLRAVGGVGAPGCCGVHPPPVTAQQGLRAPDARAYSRRPPDVQDSDISTHHIPSTAT